MDLRQLFGAKGSDELTSSGVVNSCVLASSKQGLLCERDYLPEVRQCSLANMVMQAVRCVFWIIAVSAIAVGAEQIESEKPAGPATLEEQVHADWDAGADYAELIAAEIWMLWLRILDRCPCCRLIGVLHVVSFYVFGVCLISKSGGNSRREDRRQC